MKKLTLALMLVGGAFAAGQSFAQTCAAPITIFSNSSVTGDTCTSPNTLPTYGGSPSPQREVIYSFVANNANATISVAQTGGFANSAAGVFLLPACTSSTDPTAFGFVGTPMQVSGLTNGSTYYVVVTADGTSPDASCGQYTATVTGILPVSLQKFSVE